MPHTAGRQCEIGGRAYGRGGGVGRPLGVDEDLSVGVGLGVKVGVGVVVAVGVAVAVAVAAAVAVAVAVAVGVAVAVFLATDYTDDMDFSGSARPRRSSAGATINRRKRRQPRAFVLRNPNWIFVFFVAFCKNPFGYG